MVITYIVGLSVVIQFIAAFLAVRLIRLTQHRVAWLFISIAMLIMAFRRLLPLSHAIAGQYELVDPVNETSALVISILLSIAMTRISPIFTESSRAYAAKQQAEITLRESQENLLLAHKVGNIGVWRNDLITGAVFFDERASQHYGFDTQETTLAEVLSRVHPDDVERLKGEIAAATSPELAGRVETEYRVIHPDGQVCWLAIHGKTVFVGENSRRRAVMGFGTSQDITERKQVQEKLEELNQTLWKAYDETIEGWSHALDLRDHETEGHSQRVTELTIQMGRVLGLSEVELHHLQRGALLHDVGKFGIPDHILLKPADLDPVEWKIMRQHPQYAYDLLSPISFLRPALDIPYCHHEKWDGSGYPRGLRGEEIPLAARIFAIIDVWDALRSDRPYRPAWTKAEAMAYLEREAGHQFDPEIVRAFVRFIEERE